MEEADALEFAQAIVDARGSLHYCSSCQTLTDGTICTICANNTRDKSIVCVVERPQDIPAIEKTREFVGYYHVLHGLISPLDGIGPDDLRIKDLLVRVNSEVTEVIMATNPTVEGDATALYVARLLQPLGVTVSRLAFGIPLGGDLEYADTVTLSHAIEGRRLML